MPPRPSHRLDLLVVPQPGGPEDLSRLRGLWAALEARGVVEAGGGPGPAADHLVPGGFRRLRLDDPGHTVLYANQQGGFRVRCPRCDENLVPGFQAARQVGGVEVACPACGAVTPLPGLRYLPPAAFGRGALVVAQVESATFAGGAEALFQAHLGAYCVVGRRVS